MLDMSAYTLSGYVIIPADTAASYNICVRLQDSFKLIDYYGSDVMSAAAFIDILLASDSDTTKKGMAIGKVAEVEGALDVGWNLIARKIGRECRLHTLHRQLTYRASIMGSMAAMPKSGTLQSWC